MITKKKAKALFNLSAMAIGFLLILGLLGFGGFKLIEPYLGGEETEEVEDSTGSSNLDTDTADSTALS